MGSLENATKNVMKKCTIFYNLFQKIEAKEILSKLFQKVRIIPILKPDKTIALTTVECGLHPHLTGKAGENICRLHNPATFKPREEWAELITFRSKPVLGKENSPATHTQAGKLIYSLIRCDDCFPAPSDQKAYIRNLGELPEVGPPISTQG